jgi:hypothetical protein
VGNDEVCLLFSLSSIHSLPQVFASSFSLFSLPRLSLPYRSELSDSCLSFLSATVCSTRPRPRPSCFCLEQYTAVPLNNRSASFLSYLSAVLNFHHTPLTEENRAAPAYLPPCSRDNWRLSVRYCACVVPCSQTPDPGDNQPPLCF